MPTFERDGIELYYEEQGEGFPVLFIAPGGMRSAIPFWDNAPWNPVAELASEFRCIAMDQRNAGQSTAPVTAEDGWQSYTADQLALLDYLQVDCCHVVGMCIGGPYGLGLIDAAPERVASAVLFQPIGLDNNRDAFYEMFDSWAAALTAERADIDATHFAPFRERMFGGDFLFNVDRSFVQACTTPLLVPCGNDLYHPRSTSLELVELAPNAELLENWKTADAVPAARERVRSFLRAHTTP